MFVFSDPRNDPAYRSALAEARVYGVTHFTAIYDGSRWVAEVGKLRDGRYALVTRLPHPQTGALQPFIGTRDQVRESIWVLTEGDLCNDAPFAQLDCDGCGDMVNIHTNPRDHLWPALRPSSTTLHRPRRQLPSPAKSSLPALGPSPLPSSRRAKHRLASATCLLDHVSQLMRDQATSFVGRGRVLLCAEYQVLAHRVSTCVHPVRRCAAAGPSWVRTLEKSKPKRGSMKARVAASSSRPPAGTRPDGGSDAEPTLPDALFRCGLAHHLFGHRVRATLESVAGLA